MNEFNQWNVNESDPCHLRAWPIKILSMLFSMLSFFLLAGRMETTPIKAMYEKNGRIFAGQDPKRSQRGRLSWRATQYYFIKYKKVLLC